MQCFSVLLLSPATVRLSRPLAFCCNSSVMLLHLQLSAMDVSVRSAMKGAAKCDKHCELQNSVNRQGLERILCFWDIPESMPASVSMLCCSSGCCLLRACCCDCLCLRMCAGASEAFDQERQAQWNKSGVHAVHNVHGDTYDVLPHANPRL